MGRLKREKTTKPPRRWLHHSVGAKSQRWGENSQRRGPRRSNALARTLVQDIRPRRMSSFSPIRPDSDLSRTYVIPAENPAPVENPGPAAAGSPAPADSPTPTKSAASPAQEDGTSATPEIQSAANVSAGPEATLGYRP
ncbi:PREDICTED: uncharacterized protein LOC109462151 [Branchiostoma belcheri]|uniref:Uncharacterized protein LOC109462151 n=1 Tax=Branchiostoma belcheri TaxID=7741 RepID=A0A6P4XQ44_BRABE|nr:PREDICTED: uncharacterized protein LOC109462151 [Branchiostoma belcheri]